MSSLPDGAVSPWLANASSQVGDGRARIRIAPGDGGQTCTDLTPPSIILISDGGAERGAVLGWQTSPPPPQRHAGNFEPLGHAAYADAGGAGSFDRITLRMRADNRAATWLSVGRDVERHAGGLLRLSGSKARG
ncbi:hypothetical protein [Methylobacterium sp. E-016]|uniref:hypothetical protein n=1 Tax=Methylobacterium sp. E-016 TaxID=2836556 RepID=UPI001FBBB92E|nr:hypothetical protein [Methylobacterium sp. E-016]